MKSSDFKQRYFKLLQQHLQWPAEMHLATAADLGRELVQAGIPPEEIAEIHDEALQDLIQVMPDMPLRTVALPMSALQSELLMAYGLYFREKEEQLQKSLQEKEVLLAEIHHRVKNNLQIMSSLFHMQIRFNDNPAILGLLKDSQSRIRAMAMIHEQLYNAQDFALVNLGDYIKTLANYLVHLYGVKQGLIRVQYQLDSILLPMDSAIPCGLILNELIVNALKHAFKDHDSGEIQIHLTAMPNQEVCLMIQDNGVGWVEKPSTGKPKSLGMHVVRSLIQQIRGTLTITNCGGTQVKIGFKP